MNRRAIETWAQELVQLHTDLGSALEALDALPRSLGATAVRAHLLSRKRDFRSSAEAWREYMTQAPVRESEDLAEYAAVLTEIGDFDGAAQQIRRALSQQASPLVCARIAGLVKRVAPNVKDWLRTCRVALLSTSTTDFLASQLNIFCLRDRIQLELYQGAFGALHQEILDADGGLHAFRPDVVILASHWRDLNINGVTNSATSVTQIVDGHRTLWEVLSRLDCHVIQFAFDYPAEEPAGYFSNSSAGGRIRLINEVNSLLNENCPSGVSILDTPQIQRESGSHQWENTLQWYSFRQHPSTEATSLLADALAAHLRSLRGLTSKVLVTDLDDTLWGGIIGEEGVGGIRLGPGSPVGEAYRDLQSYLKELHRRGVLLAVCSKNNPDDARLAFLEHRHMVLRLEDFAAFEANWEDKAANIRKLSHKLSIGLESFVFLDNNQVEREWVRSQLPDVKVVELGSNVYHYVRDLDRTKYFYSLSISSEDLVRTEQYRQEDHRKGLLATSASLEEFLRDLRMEGSVEPLTSSNLKRVVQLIQKTNQFNLTNLRLSEAEVQRIGQAADHWAGVYQLTDSIGSYGIVGTILCVPGLNDREWEVRIWVMSCRVLGRTMEHFMFERLLNAARLAGVERLVGIYRPARQNQQVGDLYSRLGFAPENASPDEKRLALQVPASGPQSTTSVRLAASLALT